MLNRKIIISMTILIISMLSIGELYRTEVDADYGFYAVRNVDNPAAEFTYNNRTLNINIGDTIEWISMVDPEETITIVSDHFGLFDNNRLRWSYQRFNYTFNEAGTYDIWISQYPRLKQKIILSYTTNINPDNLLANPALITQTVIPTQTNILITPTETLQMPIKESPDFRFGVGLFLIVCLYILIRKY